MLRPRARRALKNAYFRALATARVETLIRRLRNREGDVLVLSLHGVSPTPKPYWPPLTPEAFERLVDYLKATCDVRTFAQLAEPPRPGRPRVVLSFDDGYRDFIDYAMPILERHGLRANQNLIVSSVESGRPPWIVAVMDALGAADTGRVRTLRMVGFDHRLQSDDDAEKDRFGTLLAAYLKRHPPEQRTQLFPDLAALLEDTDPDAWTPMLSLDDAIAIKGIHELGGHSYSHESMEYMDEPTFKTDIELCERFFATVDTPMRIFAFPNGSYRGWQIDALRSRGVEHVLLVGERVSTANTSVHPRITIYGDTQAELRLRTIGFKPPFGLLPGAP